MKLDLTVIKNESVIKFEKSLGKVNNYFRDMLAIALDAAAPEIDKDKRDIVEQSLTDMFEDESGVLLARFIALMNSSCSFVEDSFVIRVIT